jgi:hypothetical protein
MKSILVYDIEEDALEKIANVNDTTIAEVIEMLMGYADEMKKDNGLISNNRVNSIAEFAQRRESEKIAKEKALQQQIEDYISQIRKLKPRIDELITVGNACLQHGIELTGHAWGGHEGYDTHQFFTNCWSHLVGFIHNKDNTITHLGIYAGGACGKYDFFTDGVEVYDRHEETCQKVTPAIYHLKRFVEKFDEFEREFYAYVDKVCQSK